jgi:2-C-methyl-D-erythritol 2,4-cyclodiphosphate synthase
MTHFLRIGIGFDIHPLAEDRKLILGGVEIPYSKGLLGHSDADVLIHASIFPIRMPSIKT